MAPKRRVEVTSFGIDCTVLVSYIDVTDETKLFMQQKLIKSQRSMKQNWMNDNQQKTAHNELGKLECTGMKHAEAETLEWITGNFHKTKLILSYINNITMLFDTKEKPATFILQMTCTFTKITLLAQKVDYFIFTDTFPIRVGWFKSSYQNNKKNEEKK